MEELVSKRTGAQPQAQKVPLFLGAEEQTCDGEGETLLDGVTDGVMVRVGDAVAVTLRVGVTEGVEDGGITQVWFTMYAHTLGHVHAPSVTLYSPPTRRAEPVRLPQGTHDVVVLSALTTGAHPQVQKPSDPGEDEHA